MAWFEAHRMRVSSDSAVVSGRENFQLSVPEAGSLSTDSEKRQAKDFQILKLPPALEGSRQTPAVILEKNSDLAFHSAQLHKGPMDRLADSLKSMPPSISKVAIPDLGRSDGMVRTMTIQKVDENTFFIRNDWECAGERSQLFAFKRDEQGRGWRMSSVEAEAGKFYDSNWSTVGESEKHHSERAAFCLKKINENLDNLRPAAVIEGAARHGWFNPAEPPRFTEVKGLMQEAKLLAKLKDGTFSLATEPGNRITLEKMDNGTFAVRLDSGAAYSKETIIFSESAGKWHAVALREQPGGSTSAIRLDAAAQKTWGERLEILSEASTQRLMMGGYYDPQHPPEFRTAPGLAKLASEVLNDNLVAPNASIQRRNQDKGGVTNVLEVANLGNGIFSLTNTRESAEGRVLDSRCCLFQTNGAELRVAMVDKSHGEFFNVGPREAGRRLAPGAEIESTLKSLKPVDFYKLLERSTRGVESPE